jgi:uncharacterized protein (TIGR02466 family)
LRSLGRHNIEDQRRVTPHLAPFIETCVNSPPSLVAKPSTLLGATYSHLFSVPFMTHVWKDSESLNAQLRARILAHASLNPGVKATNAGGWHSEYGQLEFLGELREVLVERMLLMTNEATNRLLRDAGAEPVSLRWSFHAWANVSDSGAFNAIHSHPGMTWSGVYYIDAGETPGQGDSGTLRLIDPIPASSASFLPRIVPVYKEIQPIPGLMILFPSYLPHSVHPHGGSRQRISIAFNFRNEPYP